MPLTLHHRPDRLIAALSGEIDHHGAYALRQEIDEALRRTQPKTLVLDFREVSFMDSSGIGLVMGRYRQIKEWNGGVEIHNPSPSIRKVMRLAGLERIAGFYATPPKSGEEIATEVTR